MAKAICVPLISEGIQEVVLSKWYKKVGEKVEKNEAIAEVEIDVAMFDIYSDFSGYLLCISAQEGNSAKVEDLIAVVGYPGEDYQAILTKYHKIAYETINAEIKIYGIIA